MILYIWKTQKDLYFGTTTNSKKIQQNSSVQKYTEIINFYVYKQQLEDKMEEMSLFILSTKW